MAYGFAAFNDNQKFLISDNFDNLHFLGQATVNNSLKEVIDDEFTSGDLSSVPVCASAPSATGKTTGADVRSTGNCAGGTNDPSGAFNGGGTYWPMTCTNRNAASSCWVDLGCGQVVTDWTITYSGRPAVIYIFYGNSPPTYESNSISGIIFDSRHAGHLTPESGTKTVSMSVRTKLPYRYWGFFFPAAGDPGLLSFTDNLDMRITQFEPTYATSNSLDYANALNARVAHTFSITTSGDPMAFIKPTDTSRWHALISQTSSGDVHTFKILVSGEDNIEPPSIYCFVGAEHLSTSETVGLLVRKPDGSKTFDSRLRPLSIHWWRIYNSSYSTL